jgi:predicted metal-binding protein
VKVTHSANDLSPLDTNEKTKEYVGKIFKDVNAALLKLLHEVEKLFPEGVGVSAGGCGVCPSCARKDSAPCRIPGTPRHSLESLGFDVGLISDELLGMRLLWMKDSIPEYHVLVNAFFTKADDAAVGVEIESRLGRLIGCPL